MRFGFRDGGRSRSVDATPDGAGRYRVTVDGAEWAIEATVEDGRLRLSTQDSVTVAEVTAVGTRRFVRLGTLDFVLDREVARRGGRGGHAGGLEAPMPGLVTRVLVKAGEAVKKGQPLVALEAMKMEHLIRAPQDGKITRVLAKAGEMADGGAALVEMEE